MATCTASDLTAQQACGAGMACDVARQATAFDAGTDLGTAGRIDVSSSSSDAGDADEVADVVAGGLVIRLVAPRSADSPYAQLLADGGERLVSVTWALRDGAAGERQLTGAGLGVVRRAGTTWVTDPADTLGISMEWAPPAP